MFLSTLFCLTVLHGIVYAGPSLARRDSCPSNNVACPNGKCIRRNWLCDGDNDCDDNWDEEPERCPNGIQCQSGYRKCPNSNRCIRENYFCDGDNDCGDNSDEQSENCEFDVSCQEGYSQCPSSRRCIRDTWFCDGDDDCGDNSDESSERCPNGVQCRSGYAKCPNSNRCINQNYFCDGDNDCGDNSDEDPGVCGSRDCSAGYQKCPNPPHRCIRQEWFCDGDNDCGDNSDESSCSGSGSGSENAASILQQCGRMVEMNCARPLMQSFGGDFGSPAFLEKVRNTHLRELCVPVLEFQTCAIRTARECGFDPSLLPSPTYQRVFLVYNYTINYICRYHVDEIEAQRNCLLSPHSMPNLMPDMPNVAWAVGQCESQAQGPQHGPCSVYPAVPCVAGNLESVCGSESAELLRAYARDTAEILQCPTNNSYKKRGVKYAKKALHSAKDTIFKKLLKTLIM